ncbi:Atu2307/SP_0267 family LLM class monooxygenase [Deinococcus radiophilus]|uniref:LLM class flavin-dependent oxidoreductase n=1 Tax=Deinococcus radiophilus TaxID=32062 RepID=A0A3S0I1L2_9DEIO|nr:Atu2307/SP_0267 family LLM class monooxygenase [Deinococcus radiophilus]RTR25355.1 LLM class flavin-dependent oxidoreductase [Deinococcus radiophilus]UFA51643.1 LLM class flavin-dependent oxidoreductase [Deinococcus radiophilus]
MTQLAPAHFELGLHTFVPYAERTSSGQAVSPRQEIRNLLEQAQLADEVGLDVFAIGEHHRPDYLASSPATLLAGVAATTHNIRLSSAVTVLGTDDPVRVFQQFATLDLLSGGRAEIMAGRGSFSESFPLFLGPSRFDYDQLFAERLELLLRLREETHVTWQGQTRPALGGEGVYPRPVQDPLPVWLAVGGTPASAVRAGTLGLPMALAIIGGEPERFVPFAELYRRAAEQAGTTEQTRLSINSHGFVARGAQAAADAYFPAHAEQMNRIGRERGWPPLSRASYERDRELRGALLVGDPQQVTEKILYQHELFGHDRCLLQTVGMMDHRDVMEFIELLGTEVAPAVRAEVARRRG